MLFNKIQKKIIFVAIFCLLFVVVGLRLISHVTFESANPIVAGIGLSKIYFFGVEYVIVKEEPKIIITRPKDSLNRLVKYMNEQRFTLVEQLGSQVIFENNISEKKYIKININSYCSRWIWN